MCSWLLAFLPSGFFEGTVTYTCPTGCNSPISGKRGRAESKNHFLPSYSPAFSKLKPDHNTPGGLHFNGKILAFQNLLSFFFLQSLCFTSGIGVVFPLLAPILPPSLFSCPWPSHCKLNGMPIQFLWHWDQPRDLLLLRALPLTCLAKSRTGHRHKVCSMASLPPPWGHLWASLPEWGWRGQVKQGQSQHTPSCPGWDQG